MIDLRYSGFRASMGVSLFCLVLVVIGLPGCAPSRAKMVREQRNTTIGLLGASYRPTGNVGIGVAGGAAKNDIEIDREKKSYASNKTEDANIREMKETSTTVSPFVHFYPWETSAFFWGAGVNFTKNRFQFDEEKEGSTSLAPAFTGVTYESTATDIHVPLGWHWIWENGVTVMLDFGPSATVAYSGRYTNDGGDDGVNAAQRDQSVEALDRAKKGGLRFAGSSIIGYSF
jgi:hypothetical protein